MVNPNLPFRIKVISLTADQLENYNSSSFHRDELLFTTKKVKLSLGDQTFHINPQHIVLIPKNLNRAIHIVEAESKFSAAGAKKQSFPTNNRGKKFGYILSLSERYLNAITDSFISTAVISDMMKEPKIFHYSQSDWQRLLSLMMRLSEELPHAKTEIDQKLIFALATQLLIELYRSNSNANEDKPELDEREQLAYEIKYFIEDHFIHDISLGDIEEEFQISASTANRLFHQYFQSTIHQCIIELRLQYAHHCIETGYSITESWQKAGFNDYSNFYRSFIKRYDYKPHNIKPKQ